MIRVAEWASAMMATSRAAISIRSQPAHSFSRGVSSRANSAAAVCERGQPLPGILHRRLDCLPYRGQKFRSDLTTDLPVCEFFACQFEQPQANQPSDAKDAAR